MIEHYAWHSRAACQGLDDLFFGSSYEDEHGTNKSEPGRYERIRKAKAVCADCAVRQDCEDWVKANPQGHGIWAGLTTNERRRAGWMRTVALPFTR